MERYGMHPSINPPNTPAVPLEAKLDELIDALRSHTQAVFMWADACNALLNAMLAEEVSDDERYLTDMKGNRIRLPTTGGIADANSTAST